MRYYCPLLSTLLLFLILYSTDLATGASSCPSKCGNISIPYPFGIGNGCYLNEWYEVQCNNSISGKPVPYLPKINKEVVSIDLPNPEYNNTQDGFDYLKYGELRIKTNITSTGCSISSNMDGRTIGEVLNFTDTPFSIGPKNTLTAIGCNNKAMLTNLETIVGCMSDCGLSKKIDTECNGYKCCQAVATVEQIGSRVTYHKDAPKEDAPKKKKEYFSYAQLRSRVLNIGTQVIGVSIEGIENTQSCRVAFLADEFGRDSPIYLVEKLTDPQWFYDRKYVTVQLRWVIQSLNDSFISSLGCELNYLHPNKSVITCKCNHRYKELDNNANNTSIGSCQCSKGYEGNPYLPGGCKDIDECQKFKSDGKSSEKPSLCSESETCENTPGSFRCVRNPEILIPYKEKSDKILKIAIGLSVGFGVLICIGISFWLSKFIKRRKEIKRKIKYFKLNGGLLLQQQLTSREGMIENTRVFTSKELEKATENFSLTRVLGQGGQGTVYKGMLVDGSIVAVKKSKLMDRGKVEEFINEVVILSQINHRNIVKLLGCCLETEVPLLVYEFIPNGNLSEHLHDECDDYTLATWEVRLRIALDIAEAVSYLHSAATSPIYHRDIKTMNIMLDEKYRGKVSDFGTSRSVTVDQTHLTTLVSGTFGYLDPEYYQSSQLTDKSDVYSFGVVLVELITGQRPISVMRSPENKNSVTYFNLAMKENKLVDIIDPRIRDGCKLEQVIATAQLAKRCLNLSGKRRPNMRAVAMELERIRSPDGNSQSDAQIVEDDEDEGAVEINIGFESYDNVGVTAPSVLQDNAATTSWSDAEPLFPRQTW